MGICMENSAVVEHVKLCISTIPARTAKSQRLAGSEDKAEQIHTLCRPEDSSIPRSSLWQRLYGSLASTQRCPHERSDTRIPGAVPGCRCAPGATLPLPAACPPGRGPSHAGALPQPSAGGARRRDARNQGGTRCNTLLLTGRKTLRVFAALRVRRSFRIGAETLVYCFTVPYTGFLFSSL